MHTHVSDKLLFSLAFRKEQELWNYWARQMGLEVLYVSVLF